MQVLRVLCVAGWCLQVTAAILQNYSSSSLKSVVLILLKVAAIDRRQDPCSLTASIPYSYESGRQVFHYERCGESANVFFGTL